MSMPSGNRRPARNVETVTRPATASAWISCLLSGNRDGGVGILNVFVVFVDAKRSPCGPQLSAGRGILRVSAEKFTMVTILVADDEPLIRWAVREALEAAGYRVIEAGTARETISRMSEADG